MTDGKPGLKTIFQINVRLLVAVLALFYGWLCWRWTSPEWWGLGLTAILMFIGGGGMFVAAVIKVILLDVRRREIAAYKRQGGTPRADRMADDSDLKRRGLIR